MSHFQSSSCLRCQKMLFLILLSLNCCQIHSFYATKEGNKSGLFSWPAILTPLSLSVWLSVCLTDCVSVWLTVCDDSKQIFFWSIVFNDCKNTVIHMLGPSLMNQNLMEHRLKYCMPWWQEYYFFHVGTFCDTSKLIIFLTIVCSDCKNSFSSSWDILWCIKMNFLLK